MSEIHQPSALAAQRGEPSYVWRSGQERRLMMIAHYAALQDSLLLVDGCGVGTYVGQFRKRYTPYVEALDIEPARIVETRQFAPHALVAAAEHLPYPSDRFNVVLSNEVIE